MTEQQIKDGYDGLQGALAPPLDALERVDRRVRQRRRQRRTALAGTGALGMALAAGLVVSGLSGTDPARGPQVATEAPRGPTSTLVLTREDGSTVPFPDVTISCTPPVTEAGDPISSGEGRIWMYSPIAFRGSEDTGDVEVEEPFVYFEGVVRKLQGDRTFTFPEQNEQHNLATEDMPMILFAADPDSAGPHGANEVSSQESKTTGTVRVVKASCDPTPVLELVVDSSLGSEVDGPNLSLAGTVR